MLQMNGLCAALYAFDVLSRTYFVSLTYLLTAKKREELYLKIKTMKNRMVFLGGMILPSYHIRANLQRHEVREHSCTSLRHAAYFALA